MPYDRGSDNNRSAPRPYPVRRRGPVEKNLDEIAEKRKQKKNDWFIKVKLRSCKKQTISQDEYAQVLSILVGQFPKAFSYSGVKILKKNIHKDLIQQTGLDKRLIKGFLYRYCNLSSYINAHTEGAARYDLEGSEVEYISDQEVKNKDREEKVVGKLEGRTPRTPQRPARPSYGNRRDGGGGYNRREGSDGYNRREGGGNFNSDRRPPYQGPRNFNR
jgi:hypothetical protein